MLKWFWKTFVNGRDPDEGSILKELARVKVLRPGKDDIIVLELEEHHSEAKMAQMQATVNAWRTCHGIETPIMVLLPGISLKCVISPENRATSADNHDKTD